MSDQESLLGSGIALILKTGAKHSGQLIHIDTSNSSITVQHVVCLGSEDRPTQDGRPVPPSPHVQEHVVFSAHEIGNIEFFPYQHVQQAPEVPSYHVQQPSYAQGGADQHRQSSAWGAPQQLQQQQQPPHQHYPDAKPAPDHQQPRQAQHAQQGQSDGFQSGPPAPQGLPQLPAQGGSTYAPPPPAPAPTVALEARPGPQGPPAGPPGGRGGARSAYVTPLPGRSGPRAMPNGIAGGRGQGRAGRPGPQASAQASGASPPGGELAAAATAAAAVAAAVAPPEAPSQEGFQHVTPGPQGGRGPRGGRGDGPRGGRRGRGREGYEGGRGQEGHEGGRGGRGPGQGPPRSAPMLPVPTTEFNFDEGLQKFDKQKLKEEEPAMANLSISENGGQADSLKEEDADFFDALSGGGDGRGGRGSFNEQRKMDMETFGGTGMARPFAGRGRRGGGRGRGGRDGPRGRGGRMGPRGRGGRGRGESPGAYEPSSAPVQVQG